MRADPASFLGRMEELELIRRLLVDGTARLLTLTGPAGVGKTRLALEVVRRFGSDFPNGARFVDLDGPLLHARDRTPGIEYRNGVMQIPPRELWG